MDPTLIALFLSSWFNQMYFPSLLYSWNGRPITQALSTFWKSQTISKQDTSAEKPWSWALDISKTTACLSRAFIFGKDWKDPGPIMPFHRRTQQIPEALLLSTLNTMLHQTDSTLHQCSFEISALRHDHVRSWILWIYVRRFNQSGSS